MKSKKLSRPRPNEPAFATADLAEMIRRCRDNGPFMSALRRLLDQAQSRVDASGGRCLGGGGCCKFDLAGFRLYLSTGELALLTTVRPPERGSLRKDRCPYQVGPRCMGRSVRPLGCRVYFCRNISSTAPANAANVVYEDIHTQVLQLHTLQDVPYAYQHLIRGLPYALDSGYSDFSS